MKKHIAMRLSRFVLASMLALMGCTLSVSAQQEEAQLEVIYKQLVRHEPSNPEGAVDVNFVMLSVGATRAIAQDYAAYQLDSVEMIPDASEELLKEYKEQMLKAQFFLDPKVEQNVETQTLTIHDFIVPEYFYYSEDFMNAWELAAETKEIGGYNCSLATIEYGGRKWRAWFTEEIPVPFGPWKLAGLPGLILGAEDESGEVVFELAELRSAQGMMPPMEVTRDMTKTDRESFVERKNEIAPDPLKRMDMRSLSQVHVYLNPDGSRSMAFNGVPVRVNANGYIPLEK